MKRVLVTAAHPDDVDYVCAGTIASLVAGGAEVSLVVVTSGEAGLPVDAPDPFIREAEQRAAAAVLGVASVRFLRYPDGCVEPTLELRHDLTASIRAVQPDLVITHTPRRNLSSVRSSHPDHLAVGEATMRAVYPDARNARAHPDLLDHDLPPHIVAEVWLHGVELPDFAVDITDYFDQKMAAVRSHESQLAGLGSDPAGFFRGWGLETAAKHQVGSDRMAEDYLRVLTA